MNLLASPRRIPQTSDYDHSNSPPGMRGRTGKTASSQSKNGQERPQMRFDSRLRTSRSDSNRRLNGLRWSPKASPGKFVSSIVSIVTWLSARSVRVMRNGDRGTCRTLTVVAKADSVQQFTRQNRPRSTTQSHVTCVESAV